VREAATGHAAKHKRLIRSARDGRILSAELAEAREAFCETVVLFDYAECETHLRGLPSRAKVKELHRYWFDTGIPLVVELADS
jgi:hypothetical protein